MRFGLSPLEKEWRRTEKQEQVYLQKRMEKRGSAVNCLLGQKVPPKLQNTLDAAFVKAFALVFEKGTGIVEKTYRREELEKSYRIDEYAAEVKDDRKTLKTFSRKAAGTGRVNLLLSGVSGVGLGLLGIGLPDVVLFTGLLLKSVYQTALHYGFDYESEDERRFVLLVIQGALSYGTALQQVNDELNYYIEKGSYSQPTSINEGIRKAAGCLSGELLYMKFLQGIPIVGAVGGACDAICMRRVVSYAGMKYRRRFYAKRRKR